MSIFNNFNDFIIEVCIGTAFDCEENEIKEGEITVVGTPIKRFTSKQQEILNKLKEHAKDVEFEEIQC